jgi:hypothetical protein
MAMPGSRPCSTTPTGSATSNKSEATEKGANVQVDLAYVFGILKKTAFRGYLSMEYGNSGDPYQETEELIAKTLAFLS